MAVFNRHFFFSTGGPGMLRLTFLSLTYIFKSYFKLILFLLYGKQTKRSDKEPQGDATKVFSKKRGFR